LRQKTKINKRGYLALKSGVAFLRAEKNGSFIIEKEAPTSRGASFCVLLFDYFIQVLCN
jgi:hypothetical protein